MLGVIASLLLLGVVVAWWLRVHSHRWSVHAQLDDDDSQVEFGRATRIASPSLTKEGDLLPARLLQVA